MTPRERIEECILELVAHDRDGKLLRNFASLMELLTQVALEDANGEVKVRFAEGVPLKVNYLKREALAPPRGANLPN